MSKGKLILEGTMRLLSPAMIGSGRDDNSDIDVIRDSDGNPYIPATSFVGVLRQTIELDKQYKSNLEDFWGVSDEGNEKNIQSSVIVRDLLPTSVIETTIRDGVKIDNKKGIAQEGAKFDYEVIGLDSEFNLYMELTLNGNNNEFKRRMLATIIDLLNNERIRIGAKTNSGFGRIKLSEHKVYEFDFSKRQDVLRWFKQDFSVPTTLNLAPFMLNKKRTVTIKADFSIKNSLIVRSNNYDPDLPDVEHIKSKGKPILPGTSVKGAIRARAERIANTLGKAEIITGLFGDVNEQRKEAKRSRITVEESLIEGYTEEVQTRIKIDRFTGGVMESALLETKPLFSAKDDRAFSLQITINDYKDHEAGLMLLVLKDLWTGDLPIGGEKAVGRGVLIGKRACISWDGEEIEFENISQLNEEQKGKLNKFISSLVNYGGVA